MTGEQKPTTDGTVDVNIVTADGPELVSVGGGAIQITVGGDRLNRFEHEDDISGEGWSPEYVGDFLVLDLPEMLDIAVDVYREDIDRYDTATHLLEGFRYYFLFEPIGDGVVRLAFQTREQIDPDLAVPYPAPMSARGYAIDSRELAEALLDAYGTFIDRATEHGVENEITGCVDHFEEVTAILAE